MTLEREGEKERKKLILKVLTETKLLDGTICEGGEREEGGLQNMHSGGVVKIQQLLFSVISCNKVKK